MKYRAPHRSLWYKNNPLLRRANIQLSWTKWEEEEFKKCANDALYFAENYIKIVHVDRGLIPFEIWDFQKELIQTCEKNRFVIGKWPRQQGKSTTVVSYLLWFVLFHLDVNVAILSNKAKGSQVTLSRLQTAYMYLPDFLKQGIITWNKRSIEFENGSKVQADSTTASSVRGDTINIVFLDEFAHVPNNIADEFFNSTYPTISSGETTKLIIVSTPKGMNKFYEIWQDSIDGKNSYVRSEVHWSQVPGRDQKWKEMTIKNTSEEQFRQEFECEFLGSTNTLISPARLKLLRTMAENPQYRDMEGFLKIYRIPDKKRVYAITVDPSQGQNLDYSAFSVFDISEVPYVQVATYQNNNISPHIFPTIIFTVAKKYCDAFILVEINDVGIQIADTLHFDLAYENLIKLEVKNKQGQTVSGGYKKKIQYGLRQTVATKRMGCANLKALVENDKLIIPDMTTVLELYSFNAHKTSFAAEEGKNDDLCMTLVMFAWLTSQKYFKENIKLDIRRIMQEEMLNIMDKDIVPFGIITDGRDNRDGFVADGDLWFEASRETRPYDVFTWNPWERL